MLNQKQKRNFLDHVAARNDKSYLIIRIQQKKALKNYTLLWALIANYVENSWLLFGFFAKVAVNASLLKIRQRPW